MPNTQTVASRVAYVVIDHPVYIVMLNVRSNVTDATTAYPVALDWSPCPFGGARPWFLCPLVVVGEPCRRRVRILYRPWGSRYFGCRRCHHLTYRSRQLHRDRWYEGFDRPMAAAERYQRAMDPRCSWKRRYRATQKLERLLPAMTALSQSMDRGSRR